MKSSTGLSLELWDIQEWAIFVEDRAFWFWGRLATHEGQWGAPQCQCQRQRQCAKGRAASVTRRGLSGFRCCPCLEYCTISYRTVSLTTTQTDRLKLTTSATQCRQTDACCAAKHESGKYCDSINPLYDRTWNLEPNTNSSWELVSGMSHISHIEVYVVRCYINEIQLSV
jgi:hypothetical protein